MNYIPLERKRKSAFEFMNSSPKKRRKMKTLTFGGDKRILPRIKELIHSQLGASQFVDEDELLSGLQNTYPEYRRKKRGDLKAAIKKGIELFATVKYSGHDSEQRFASDFEFMPDEKYVASEEAKIKNTSDLDRGKGKEETTAKHEHNHNDLKDISPENAKDKKLNCDKNSTPAPNSMESEIKSKRKIISSKKQQSKGPVLQQSTVTFADVGGQHDNIEIIGGRLWQYNFPPLSSTFGKHTCGILIHGPSGCGKTLFARAIAGEMKYPLIEVSGTDLISGISGDSEEKIRGLFEQAVSSSPCVLFIDQIDAIVTKIESASKAMEKRIASQLLKSMDELRTVHADSKVLVIGAMNTPASLDPGFRRGGRFDLEIGIGFPDERARISILKVICRDLQLPPDFDFRWLARNTPGYVGADLAAVVSGAIEAASKRALQKLSQHLEFDSEMKSKMQRFLEEPSAQLNDPAGSKEFLTIRQASKIRVIMSVPESDAKSYAEMLTDEARLQVKDFEMARNAYVPCAKREGFASVPSVTWNDVGALSDVKEELQTLILWPIKYKELFDELELNSPGGVLFWGPKGCGKTLLAKAVANESAINFLSVKGGELFDKYVGGTEKAVRDVFERASNSAPCVLLFDEIDAIAAHRSNSSENDAANRAVTTLLSEMDGVGPRKQIFVLGTTNKIEKIDSAVLRPGRLEAKIFIGPPTPEERADILKALTKNGTKPKLAADVNLETLAHDSRCDGFSGADLAYLVRNAKYAFAKDYIKNSRNNIEGRGIGLSIDHFNVALSKTRPSISKEEMKYFEEMKLRLEKDQIAG